MVSDIDLYGATVQVYNLNDENLPVGSGSGLLVRVRNKKIILTVSHLLNGGGRIGVHLRHDANGSTCFVPADFGRLCMANLRTKAINDLDFLYFVLPQDVDVMRTSVIPIEGKQQIPNVEFEEDELDVEIQSTDHFSFTGVIQSQYISGPRNDVKYLSGTLQMHRELTLRSNDYPYIVFNLPYDNHPGHKWFRGCSGAPILNQNGKPVALVCSGDTHANTLTGISLRALLPALKVSV